MLVIHCLIGHLGLSEGWQKLPGLTITLILAKVIDCAHYVLLLSVNRKERMLAFQLCRRDLLLLTCGEALGHRVLRR